MRITSTTSHYTLSVSTSLRRVSYRKKGGVFPLILSKDAININDGVLTIPQSRAFLAAHNKHRIRIKLPPQLLNARIKEIRIIPVSRGRVFKIQYVYLCEAEDLKLSRNNSLAIDLGLNNLCACVSSDGATFIMDGRRIKSINHHWNKQRALLQAVYSKQKIHTGRLLESLTLKRNEQVQDIMRKTARYIIDYCIAHDIGTLIVGSNSDWKERINLGSRSNQNFVQIPHAYLRLLLKYHCERYGMSYVEQEESYTSKASFLDNDEIPSYSPDDKTPHLTLRE